MRLPKVLVSLFLMIFLGTAFAATSPVATLQNATNTMLAGLQKNKSRLKIPGVVSGIVNRSLLPIIDTNRMGGMVVGRKYWKKASKAQRRVFVSEFQKLVISTYSAALSAYNNDKVRFYPLRGGWKGKRAVQVRSIIVRGNGQTIPVYYNLVNNKGNWKIYDFSIDSVSMVQSYRSQFASTLASGGIQALIKRLSKHNRG